jgi:hypothetical protein
MQPHTTLGRFAARTARRGWRTIGGRAATGLVAVFLLGAPTSALAVPAACPPAPGDYAGSDAVVQELRALRQDQAASCAAITDRLDASATHTDVLPGKLDLLHDELAAPLTVAAPADSPVHVLDDQAHTDASSAPSQTSTVEFGTAAQSQIDDNTTAIRGDLWWAIGALGGGLVGFLFWRIMRPGR